MGLGNGDNHRNGNGHPAPPATSPPTPTKARHVSCLSPNHIYRYGFVRSENYEQRQIFYVRTTLQLRRLPPAHNLQYLLYGVRMHHFLLSTVTCKVGAVVSYRILYCIVPYDGMYSTVQDRTGQDRTGHTTTIPKVVWVQGLLNPRGKTINQPRDA